MRSRPDFAFRSLVHRLTSPHAALRRVAPALGAVPLIVLAAGGLTATSPGADPSGSPSPGRAAPIVEATARAPFTPAELRLEAIRARQRAPGHDFVEERGTLTATVGEGSERARVRLAGDHVAMNTRSHGGLLGIETLRAGRGRTPDAIASLRASRAEGQEVVLARDGIEERYLAGPLGLEQSFRVASPPAGSGDLAIEVRFDGLRPRAVPGTSDLVTLRDQAGRERAVCRDLAAVDGRGRSLPARMQVSGADVRLVVDDRDAVYPVVVDPLVATQQAELTATGGAAGDDLGDSAAVSGDTAVVGASHHGGTGAALVFVRSGTSWSQQAALVGGDSATGDLFGEAAAISGDTVVVGAWKNASSQGAAYVFTRTGTSWSQQGKLTASDGIAGDDFGAAVAISGDTIVVGAPWQSSVVGAVYVFTRSGTTWTQEAELSISGAVIGAAIGSSVTVETGATSGTVIAGSPQIQSYTPGGGAAYVWVGSGSSWTPQGSLSPNDSSDGDLFGTSVSISSDTTLVGAPGKAASKGVAYLFTRAGTQWTQLAKLTASDGAANDSFGSAVATSTDIALVGAPGHTSNTGTAYAYTRSGTTWSQQAELSASDAAKNDHFGVSAGLDDGTCVLGAWGHASAAGAGYAFVLERGLAEACAGGGECQSSFCVGGVCCDSACTSGTCATGTCVSTVPDGGGSTSGSSGRSTSGSSGGSRGSGSTGSTGTGPGSSGSERISSSTGSSASQGSHGSSGHASGSTSRAHDAGVDAAGGSTASSSGCGCRLADPLSGGAGALLAWAAAIAAVLRRRSRS